MRIAIISDIHSNLEALNSVLSSFRSYDRLYCLGDIVGYGAQPNEVIEVLRGLKPDLVIAGNHDYAVLTGDVTGFVGHAARAALWTRRVIEPENLKFLSRLPLTESHPAGGTSITAFHGSPREPLEEYVFPGVPEVALRGLLDMAEGEILLLGHTHLPMFYRWGKRAILNPGSVGQPRDGDPRASYAILETEDDKIEYQHIRVKYDIDSAASKIREQQLPVFLADRLYRGV